jgi:hypothetical protein
MKNFLVFFFALLIFFLSFKTVLAEEGITPTPTPVIIIDNYELPYPGLLPDHPLYFLKMTRDKLVGFFISDPIKKAEFDVLQADKRLNAAIYLINKKSLKNQELAVNTFSKGQNYYDDAITKIVLAKKQGMTTTDIKTKVKASLNNFKLILEKSKNKVSANLQKKIVEEEKIIDEFKNKAVLKD